MSDESTKDSPPTDEAPRAPDEPVREAILANANLDARRAPAFDAMWAAAQQRAKRRRSLAPIVAVASGLAVAAALAIVVAGRPDPAPPSSRSDRGPSVSTRATGGAAGAPALAATTPAPSPLDFLLDVPTSAALASPVSKDW